MISASVMSCQAKENPESAKLKAEAEIERSENIAKAEAAKAAQAAKGDVDAAVDANKEAQAPAPVVVRKAPVERRSDLNIEGIQCGDVKCNAWESCVDGQCACGNEKVPAGYVCSAWCADEVCNSVSRGVACDRKACPCGDALCNEGEVCRDGACFCDDQPSLGENFSCQKANKMQPADEPRHVEICNNPAGCACGDVTCPANAACTDGVCKCGDTLVREGYAGYECLPILETETVYQVDLVCRDSNGCPCGDITSSINMGCNGKSATCAGILVPGRSLSCKKQPHAGYNYHLSCFRDDCNCYGVHIDKGEICERLECEENFTVGSKGCTCDRLTLDMNDYDCMPSNNNKLVNVCTKEEGCACGELTCPYMTVCRKGECVDRTILKPIPEGYTVVNGLPKCENPEGCACKKKTCAEGRYCLGGICYLDPYFRKLNGKILYYRLMNPAVFGENNDSSAINLIWSLMFVDENEKLCDHSWTKNDVFEGAHTKTPVISLCADENYKNITVGEFLRNCGTGPVPDGVVNKYCHIGIEKAADGKMALGVSGWRDE